MNAKIRMGVVGLGGISNVHIPGILNSKDAELIAICDTNEELLRAVGDKYGIPSERRFVDFEQLVHAEYVDAVSICTPNFLHYPVAMEAVKCRKPFCLEKPIAMNATEAEALYEACKANDILNMVGFSYRYKPALRYAKWLIEQGTLGQIHHIYGQYLQSWAKPETPMSWRFSKRLSGTGAIGDLGSHIIDMTRFLVGDMTRVMGSAGTIIESRRNPQNDEFETVDVDDYFHYLANIEPGVSGVFSISRFAYGRGNYQRVEIYGAKGALVYSLEREDSLEVCIGTVYEQSNRFVEILVPDHFKKDQMQSFFDMLRGRDDGLNATVTDGLINQRSLDALVESFETKKWVVI